MTEAETFSWRDPQGDPTAPHQVGDTGCSECCCSYPEQCDECGGLTHSYVLGEEQIGEDWEWMHTYRCDRPCNCAYCHGGLT